MSDWIKCSERMPEPHLNVLFFCPHETDCVFAGWWSTIGEWRPNASCYGDSDVDWIPASKVTHWVPLPEPPSDGE